MTNLKGSNLNRREAAGPKGEGRDSPSTFPAYPEYKDSGVEWLGEVPAHWQVERNKRMFRIVSRPVGKSGSQYQLLSLTLRGVVPRDLDGKGKYPAEFDTYQVVQPGDVVFCLFDIDETPRTVGYSSLHGMITGAYSVAKALPESHPGYVYYYYYHIDLRKGLRPFYTGLRKVVRPETFSNLEMPCPPVLEQVAISNFLDHETARIDALVEEQQRLIALLKEKRQAVISHAVTKGLDPDVLMKDSGVEWLGKVPAHWEVCKLGHVCRLQGGYAFNSSRFSQDGVTIVRMNNLKRGRLDLENSVKIPPEDCDSRFQLAGGDILYGMSGSIGDTGSLGNYAIVNRDDLPAQLNQRVGRFVLERGLLGNYLELVIQSSSFYEQVLDQVTGTAQFNVSSDQVESCKIAFPEMEEQELIAQGVQARLVKMDRLMELAADQIHYLQERRSALISAAVTGKIDVRGWTPPADAVPADQDAPMEAV
ncbi:restriction endonuclease subunit S [Halomonas sp. B23F22_10]|uniref:restriction endonuclease subunit S n=1 Tax=Halomonas sp. B23F22_10 TaxID=3459515 RepID=UPI00373E2495